MTLTLNAVDEIPPLVVPICVLYKVLVHCTSRMPLFIVLLDYIVWARLQSFFRFSVSLLCHQKSPVCIILNLTQTNAVSSVCSDR